MFTVKTAETSPISGKLWFASSRAVSFVLPRENSGRHGGLEVDFIKTARNPQLTSQSLGICSETFLVSRVSSAATPQSLLVLRGGRGIPGTTGLIVCGTWCESFSGISAMRLVGFRG